MKSTPLIFQDFSIAGLRKQWKWQYREEVIIAKLRAGRPAPEWLSKDGCKTETRRTRGLDKVNEFAYRWQFEQVTDEHYVFTNSKNYDKVLIKCPYGVVGDEIWVKETYIELAGSFPNAGGYAYKADGVNTNEKWKSPLFMPKEASRIKLEITGISIERLHDITEEGALREGIIGTRLPAALGGGMAYNVKGNYISALDIEDSATGAYKWIWINLHGKESWDKNPFLWVITFIVKEFKL